MKKTTPPAESISPITAARLAHAASREVPGNLFRLLVDLSSTDAVGQAPPSDDEDTDLGPPWEVDPVISEAASTASDAAGPTDA
ncbi:hypothetical protein ASD25_12430 [Brevundimonas sp. Root1423]|nr:hypothetical protein ASD25_12430 [Brevundimonas sp. Root1423]